MKFDLFKILPRKLGEFKYVTRGEDGRCITFGNSKREIIKNTKYELTKYEEFVDSYEVNKIER